MGYVGRVLGTCMSGGLTYTNSTSFTHSLQTGFSLGFLFCPLVPCVTGSLYGMLSNCWCPEHVHGVWEGRFHVEAKQ